MSLMTYKEARPWARSIKEKVLTREMPPWSPDPKYGEFTNDHRLAQKDIDTIVAWVDQGAKEGEAKDLQPCRSSPPRAAGDWASPTRYSISGRSSPSKPGMPDTIQNFIVPTNFKEDKWVTAAEILPGQPKGRPSRDRVHPDA